MKKDVLIKMICLGTVLVIVAAVTLLSSDYTPEKTNDFSSVNSQNGNESRAEKEEETEESNGNPLKDANKIDETVAMKIAAKYINTENARIEKTKNEEIDTFVVANDFGTASISENGGSLVSFSKNDDEEIKNFSDRQCLQKANEFVLNYYSVTFVPRYMESNEENCFVVFTSKNGGTLCNPDKIQIAVSKKSGEILFFDASDFLLNYRNRTLRSPEYSLEEAKGRLGKDVIVEQVNQVIINKENEEKMCYEFICNTAENRKNLIYINAYTLDLEEEIILPQNKNGIFLK